MRYKRQGTWGIQGQLAPHLGSLKLQGRLLETGSGEEVPRQGGCWATGQAELGEGRKEAQLGRCQPAYTPYRQRWEPGQQWGRGEQNTCWFMGSVAIPVCQQAPALEPALLSAPLRAETMPTCVGWGTIP